MKTPREVLLQRRSAVQPRLDAVRAAVLATLPQAQQSGALVHPSWWQVALWEIFGSARTAWAGIAALGLAALGLDLASRIPSAQPEPVSRPTTRIAIAQVIEERTRILADLGPTDGWPAAKPSRTPRLQPPPAATPRKPEARRSSLDQVMGLV